MVEERLEESLTRGYADWGQACLSLVDLGLGPRPWSMSLAGLAQPLVAMLPKWRAAVLLALLPAARGALAED